MWATIRRVEGYQAEMLADRHLRHIDDRTAFLHVAYRSDPTIAIFMGDQFLTLLGFMPIGFLSGTAYVWLQPSPDLAKYRIGFARVGRGIITEARKRYPTIVGFCSAGPASEKWWASLGAKFGQTFGEAKQFIIETSNDT